MKRIVTMLVLAACSGLALAQPGASTPSVDRILDRFVQALGGRAALEKITTMAFTGVMEVQGAKGPGKTTEYFEYPDHFAAIAEIPGYGTVRTVCDGKTAWNVDPKKGVTEFSGAQLADMRHRADIHWNLKLREFYPGLELIGRENVGGRDAWVLESTVDGWRIAFSSTRAPGCSFASTRTRTDLEAIPPFWWGTTGKSARSSFHSPPE